jgi:hypothetical protein
LTQRARIAASALPRRRSITSITSWVTFPVIIEVGARCVSSSLPAALCAPIAVAPSMPAAIAGPVAIVPSGSASIPQTMKPSSSTACSR